MRVRAALVGVLGVLVATGVVVLLLSGGDSSSDSRSAATGTAVLSSSTMTASTTALTAAVSDAPVEGSTVVGTPEEGPNGCDGFRYPAPHYNYPSSGGYRYHSSSQDGRSGWLTSPGSSGYREPIHCYRSRWASFVCGACRWHRCVLGFE